MRVVVSTERSNIVARRQLERAAAIAPARYQHGGGWHCVPATRAHLNNQFTYKTVLRCTVDERGAHACVCVYSHRNVQTTRANTSHTAFDCAPSPHASRTAYAVKMFAVIAMRPFTARRATVDNAIRSRREPNADQ